MPSKQNVAEFLLNSKDDRKIAIELLSGKHSYGELRAMARSVAAYLHLVGGQKGDRVLLIADNSLFWVAAYLGTIKAGLVAVPLPRDTEDLGYLVDNTAARIAIAQSSVVAKQRAALTGLHVITDREMPALANLVTQVSIGLVCREMNGRETETEIDSHDLAALMFTSGSTGRPRGVMVSHANIMANTESIIEYLALSEADRVMAVLPFHYCFGASLLHTHLRVGGTLVIDHRFQYPETIVQRMIEAECTGFAGVPSHYQLLLRSSSLRERSFPRLRYLQQAGGHLAPKFVRELRTALPRTAIFVMYGQTEATARLACLPPACLDEKLGSIGKAIPGVTLHVLDDSGMPVVPGEVGEIVAEGKNITQGYWRAPAESAKTFRDGKLYTGDLATVDDEGFIYLKDRAKDFLKCGGNRVSCREVEDRLLEFSGIVEAAVIGVPDDVLGECVRAFVVPRNGEQNGLREELDLFCKKNLAPHLFPKQVVFVAALPKNSAGKVLKAELRNRKLAEDEVPGEVASILKMAQS